MLRLELSIVEFQSPMGIGSAAKGDDHLHAASDTEFQSPMGIVSAAKPMLALAASYGV